MAQMQSSGEVKLSKERTKELFMESEEKKMDKMKKLFQNAGQMGDPME